MKNTIEKFYLSNIKKNANIVIVGPHYSGKTTLAINILYQKQDCVIGSIFLQNKRKVDYFDDICSAHLIHNTYNKFAIMSMMENRKLIEQPTMINIFNNCFSSHPASNSMHCFIKSNNIDLSSNTPELKDMFFVTQKFKSLKQG